MKKREIIEGLAELDDDAEVVLAIVTPKDDEEEGFEMGSENNSTDDPNDLGDEDDDTVDNGDGTITTFEPIDEVQVLENEDPDNNNAKEKFGVFLIDMAGDDDEDGEDEPDQAQAN